MGNRKSVMICKSRNSNLDGSDSDTDNRPAPSRRRIRRKITAATRRRNQRESRAMILNMPEEILIEMFVRLPVESLLRLRCVCKCWYSLISNPGFTAAHLSHQKAARKGGSLLFKFFHDFGDGNFYSLRFDNDNDGLGDVKLELPDKPKRCHVYGTCNGVICFATDHSRFDSETYLWNPALRNVKILPESRIRFRHFCSYSMHVAFGFLPNVNDYKVVRMVYFSRRVNGNDVIFSELEVYKMSTDSWKKKVGVTPIKLCYLYDTVQFVNVTAYWLARRAREEGYVDLIVAFDMLNEEFEEEIMLPNCDCKREACVSMAAFGGSLYYSHCNCGITAHNNNHDCDIWILKFSEDKFTWTKQYTITNLPDIKGPPLGFRKNGEVILAKFDGSEVSYNLEEQRAVTFEVERFPKYSRIDPFLESLVLLSSGGGGNGVLALENSPGAKKAVGGKRGTKKADVVDGKRQAKRLKKERTSQ